MNRVMYSRKLRFLVMLTGAGVFLSPVWICAQHKRAGVPTTDWKRHDVGQIGLVVSNIGLFGGEGYYWITDKRGKNLIGCEYPIGSGNVYMSGAGLWVGGVVENDTIVSVSYEPPPFNFYPTDDPGDTILVRSNREESPFYDPNAVSEQDFIARYRDDFWPPGHPSTLRIDVIQRSYAWSISYLSAFVFLDYTIVSRNAKPLRDVFIGFIVDADVGNIRNINTIYEPASGDIARFDRNRMMGVMLDADGDDGQTTGRIGLRVLKVPHVPNLKTTFQWFEAVTRPPWQGRADAGKVIYEQLSSGMIKPDQLPTEAGDTRFFFGFGPFSLNSGDSLQFTVALVAGENDQRLGINADRAKELFDLDFVPPYVPPPSPPLRVTTERGHVKLDWRWRPGDAGINPEEFVDRKGNRTFEGYRVYKGVVDPQRPSAEPQRYVLLAEFDYVNGIGYDTGLHYHYTDVGVVNGLPYYYAVTSFDRGDALNDVPSLESNVRNNLKRVIVGSPVATSDEVNVEVVPNPYLGNVDYTQPARWEDFEGSGWVEQSRRVQFINLPPRCTIRIYTLAGEHVATLVHEDPTRGYLDWNLVSEANQAIASGVYLFSVESDYRTQIGKFVVIK